MYDNFCSICLEIQEILLKIAETDADDEKWASKLVSCVPEVAWSEENSICAKCVGQLQTVCTFRKLCIQSYLTRKVKTETVLFNDGLKEDLSDELHDASSIKDDEISDENFSCKTCDETPASQHELNACAVCGATFSSAGLLNRHNVLKHGDPNKWKYTCEYCNVKYPFQAHLETHVSSQHAHEVQQYICYHCNKVFSSKVILATHIGVKHGRTKKCRFCKNIYPTQILLKSHILKEHNLQKKYKCEKCLKVCESDKTFKKHALECEEMKMKVEEIQEDVKEIADVPKPKRGRKPLEKTINKCQTCGVEFSNKYLLTRHVRNVHATEKNHNCDICGQKFASPVYLSAHKRYHSGERPHICSFCGKGYITASDLYHHEKIHANKRAYKCELCPKAFNTSSDLHKHKICVHLDRSLWKYVCSFCERRFPLKTNLDTHTKTHTGERNFACHLCDRRCINRSVLMRHIESHSNVRSFKCNICSQDYKYQKSLDVHMAKAHGIGDAKIPERVKKYFCHICPKSYFANNKLQKHIRTHTGERPFPCHMCDKRFIDKSYVKQHLKTAHNMSFN